MNTLLTTTKKPSRGTERQERLPMDAAHYIYTHIYISYVACLWTRPTAARPPHHRPLPSRLSTLAPHPHPPRPPLGPLFLCQSNASIKRMHVSMAPALGSCGLARVCVNLCHACVDLYHMQACGSCHCQHRFSQHGVGGGGQGRERAREGGRERMRDPDACLCARKTPAPWPTCRGQ